MDIGADAHLHVRGADQMTETLGGKRVDLGQRLVRDQFRRQPGRHRHRHLDRLDLQPRLDTLERAVDPLQPVGDDIERRGDVLGGLVLRLRVAGGKAIAVGNQLRHRRAGARARPW